jgi:hypothetical protein
MESAAFERDKRRIVMPAKVAVKPSRILSDWMTEAEFAAAIREKIGRCEVSTLERWRRLKTIPAGFEWRHFGRVPMWREIATERE